MIKVAAFISLALLTACASQQAAAPYTWDMDFEEVDTQRRLQSEQGWYGKYMDTFLVSHAEYAKRYATTCGQYLAAGGHQHLELLFVLDASGNVLGLRTRPNVPEALCFVDFFASIQYPPPGRIFYGKLDISTRQEAAPSQRLKTTAVSAELRQLLTGSWAWTPEQCEADPIRITFSEDGAAMYHRNENGLFLGDMNAPKERVTYRILAEQNRILRTIIDGEDRLTPEGEPVGWDLVVLNESAFCWHRWDWPEGCTQPLLSCDGK